MKYYVSQFILLIVNLWPLWLLLAILLLIGWFVGPMEAMSH